MERERDNMYQVKIFRPSYKSDEDHLGPEGLLFPPRRQIYPQTVNIFLN
jgi:hypothetical protein